MKTKRFTIELPMDIYKELSIKAKQERRNPKTQTEFDLIEKYGNNYK